jgi:hypothetical protein
MAPLGSVGNGSLTISSNVTVFVVTVFFWPLTTCRSFQALIALEIRSQFTAG